MAPATPRALADSQESARGVRPTLSGFSRAAPPQAPRSSRTLPVRATPRGSWQDAAGGKDAAGSDEAPPASARLGSGGRPPRSGGALSQQPHSARATPLTRARVSGGREEGFADLDSQACGSVLHFWFEELTPDDWFLQNHAQDDRIRRQFGALHARAAAGELAGWMQHREACLALVVILDQFSRSLHRGSMQAYACDAAARLAANAALARGDDHHWPPGPHRSTLYLPFMHSEDMADKRRCVALMRSGLALSTGRLGQIAFGGGSGGKDAAAAGEAAVLPRLRAATRKAGTAKKADSDEEDDESSSGSDEEEEKLAAAAAGQGAYKPHAGAGGSQPARGSQSARGKSTVFGAYSVQMAAELPVLPVLTLNHEHAKRFRAMKLDNQTMQAYNRDSSFKNRMVKYVCLVCGTNHEFRLHKACKGDGSR